MTPALAVIKPLTVKPLVSVTAPVRAEVPVTLSVPETVVLGCNVKAVALAAPIIIVPALDLSKALVTLLP